MNFNYKYKTVLIKGKAYLITLAMYSSQRLFLSHSVHFNKITLLSLKTRCTVNDEVIHHIPRCANHFSINTVMMVLFINVFIISFVMLTIIE